MYQERGSVVTESTDSNQAESVSPQLRIIHFLGLQPLDARRLGVASEGP